MAQLQLPFLQLPDPASRGWDFLQSLGVSMELKWPTLHKVLQQLSSAGVRPPLANMQQLYKSIAALEALSQVSQITPLGGLLGYQPAPRLWVSAAPRIASSTCYVACEDSPVWIAYLSVFAGGGSRPACRI